MKDIFPMAKSLKLDNIVILIFIIFKQRKENLDFYIFHHVSQ
jgi:hypothetical protein